MVIVSRLVPRISLYLLERELCWLVEMKPVRRMLVASIQESTMPFAHWYLEVLRVLELCRPSSLAGDLVLPSNLEAYP